MKPPTMKTIIPPGAPGTPFGPTVEFVWWLTTLAVPGSTKKNYSGLKL